MVLTTPLMAGALKLATRAPVVDVEQREARGRPVDAW